MQSYKSIKITVKGRVQGVGFRPFVFATAKKFSIHGSVQNNMDGVKIIAEGMDDSLSRFFETLQYESPRLARIDQITKEEVQVQNYRSFTIIESERTGKSSLVIPVDASICPDCLIEMKDSANFRYNYPFINCTQCGPRYTIIKELPYDRPYTTMTDFHMCKKCEQEYVDPTNRRHHAQPIACPECGPAVTLFSIKKDTVFYENEAIEQTKTELSIGKIVAMKGIGGYHLACDACNDEAVRLLRTRKNRPKRPLAVMVKDIETAKKLAFISKEEERLLLSPEAPIVVMKRKKNDRLSKMVAPEMGTIGVMLPYTPLHHLIFMYSSLDMLVMTSANPSGLPMLYEDDVAFSYLNKIADFVLTNNRRIEHPVDDSVIQVLEEKIHFFRRARGYVPDPIFSKKSVHEVLALGPQQKNTFAIGRFDQIFIGPHIGDMNSEEVLKHYLEEQKHLLNWLGVEPEIIAIDKHPLYETTQLAKAWSEKSIVSVQHHHAHLVSCMEDNHLVEPCYGLILDGTGYGEDGHIWGFELLYGNANSFERLGHLQYQPLPGGEKAVKEPWRNAVGMIINMYGREEGLTYCSQLFPDKQKQINLIATMIKNKLNIPLAGTCGRLFDAVSAILGITEISSYDGEAAICLSELITEEEICIDYYSYQLVEQNKLYEINFHDGMKQLIIDVMNGVAKKEIAKKFHQTVVEMSVSLLLKSEENHRDFNKNVVLSGGSFHNRFLSLNISKRLIENGFNVFQHQKVPCNDGGVSLGQLIIAKAQVQ